MKGGRVRPDASTSGEPSPAVQRQEHSWEQRRGQGNLRVVRAWGAGRTEPRGESLSLLRCFGAPKPRVTSILSYLPAEAERLARLLSFPLQIHLEWMGLEMLVLHTACSQLTTKVSGKNSLLPHFKAI